jgi:hypothetical protein
VSVSVNVNYIIYCPVWPCLESAKSVLETFEKLGVKDEEQLQKFFQEVSLPQLGGGCTRLPISSIQFTHTFKAPGYYNPRT